MKGILEIIAGAAMVAGAFLLGGPAAAGMVGKIAGLLISAGVGMTMSGVGTILMGEKVNGMGTATRNPIAPWKVCCGRVRTGGTLIYMNTWGGNAQMLDLVIVLASHSCESLDAVLFDQKRLHIDPGGIPTSAKAGYSIPTPAPGSGTCMPQTDYTVEIAEIVRDTNGIVTVTLKANIADLQEGDQIGIQDVTGDQSLNGTFEIIAIVSQTGPNLGAPGTSSVVFQYICGGNPADVLNAGYCVTKRANYGRNVYVEPLLGNQTLGETFVGMTAGTPWQGYGNLCSPLSPQNAGGNKNIPGPNPWTNYCSLVGKTAVFIRIQYDSAIFNSGIPQISFLLHGKNDIYDPRTSPPTVGYSENAALCIADFLSNTTWGFKAVYGTEIPTDDLSAAADVCDQPVDLAAGGTEPRYTCNGQFDLTMRRGEILQNLLTSCAGRLTYVGGQYRIQPGQWADSSPPVTVDLTAIAAGPVKWRPAVSIRDLFNGVKGTYISQAYKWQSTDFPPYAQDALHGYDGPSEYGGDINLAADGGDRRWLDIQLPFTISAATAQRIAKIELLRRRHQGTGTLALNLAGYQFAPLDIIHATLNYFAWSGKVLEVAATRFRAEKQSGPGGKEVIVLGTEIDVQETDSDIYAWSIEEELSPEGYQQVTLPGNTVIEPTPYPWSPGYAVPYNGDAYLVAGSKDLASFGLNFNYGLDRQGNPAIDLLVTGNPVINSLDTGISGPFVSATGSATGGSIAPGDYVVAITALDSGDPGYQDTEYLDAAHVTVPASSPPEGSISGTIEWGSGDDGGDIYIAEWVPGEAYTWHFVARLDPGVTTFSITEFDQSTPGGPDPLFDHYSIEIQKVIHSGPWALEIRSLTADTITIIFGGMTTNQWAGRIISLLGRYDPTLPVPVINMPIASSTASATGSDGYPEFTLTIGPNAAGVQLPDLTTILNVGDLLVMRYNATFTDSSFSDPDIANPVYPTGDLHTESGDMALVLTGADAGDMQPLAGVSADGDGNFTIFDLAGKWQVTPSAGDMVIVIDSTKYPEVKSSPQSVRNKDNGAVLIAAPGMQNLGWQTWLVTVHTEDANNNRGSSVYAPKRDIFNWGAQGNRVITANSPGSPPSSPPETTAIVMLPWDSLVEADASAGPILYVCLPFSQLSNQEFTVVKIDNTANTVTVEVNSGSPPSSPPEDSFDDGTTSVVLRKQGDSLTFRVHGI